MSDEREPSGDGVVGPLPSEELRARTSHRNKALRKIYRGVTRVFRKKNQTGSFEFDPEVLCHRKKEWLESRSVIDRGLEWPQRCFEHLVIVGLPHTLDLTQVRDANLKEKTLKKSSTSDSAEKANHHTPPSPSYEAELLYQFPEEKPLHMESETLVSFCFPHGVTPQIVKRTSSMSALNDVIYGQQHLVHSDQSFVFMQKGAGDDLPMFGICYLVDQMVHHPPGLMKEKEGDVDSAQRLIAAPRCYCLLSRYPFFSLHFQVLNVVLGLERLDCISDYMNTFIKLPPESSLFSDLGLKSPNRLSSMMTPDSCAIGAFSASLTSQEVLYLDQQDECGSEEGFKLRQDQESTSGTRSITVTSSDAESQTPKARIHPRDSFSSIPGLLQSYPSSTSTNMHKLNKNKISEQRGSNPQHCCCYCCSILEVHSPCRDCSLLQKLESGRNIPLRGSASAPTQRSSLRLGSPIPPRYPDHDQASKGVRIGVQDLTLSGSHFESKTRVQTDSKTQISDSVMDGHTFQECETEVEASHCFVSCFEAESLSLGMADSASFNPSYDFRSSTTTTPRQLHIQTEDAFFTSTSMPELSHFGQKCENSSILRSRSVTHFNKCSSVGDLSCYASTKETRSWSEDESRTSSCKIENLASSRKLLCQLRDLKVPQPGETIQFSPEEEGLQSIEYTRPIPLVLDPSDLAGIEQETALGLSPWTIAVLCRSLSLDNILTLLAGALLEKQIVFFCSNLGVLTSSVLSLLPMLRPFTWHSLILSVLPSQYLDFLDAPVPFAVGIQHKTPEIAQRCKDLIRVNLYKNKVKSNATTHLTLPGAKTLHSRLTQWHKILQDSSSYSRRPSHVVTPKECNAVESFLSVLRGYFESLIGDLKRHTITDVTSSDGVSLLLEESFLEAFPVKDQPFMKAFYQTQMFSSFVDTVIGNHDHRLHQF